MSIPTRGIAATLALLLCAAPMAAQRQGDDAPLITPRAAACDYVRCALGIAPVWNGLAVVRGPERAKVANLNFFVPRPIDAAFFGDSALAYASRATRVRRAAAAFTDVGALLLATTAARGASSGRLDAAGKALAAAGAGAFVVGVPLQFSADGLLSRAVWWHNAAFSQ